MSSILNPLELQEELRINLLESNQINQDLLPVVLDQQTERVRAFRKALQALHLLLNREFKDLNKYCMNRNPKYNFLHEIFT